jgi:hypothetical protein
VVSFARDKGFFHFLSDCTPEARIVIGDGRLSLAQNVPPDLDSAISSGKWRRLAARPGRRVWTDDCGNIVSIMRW